MILQPYVSFNGETEEQQLTTMVGMINTSFDSLATDATRLSPLPIATFGRIDIILDPAKGFPTKQVTQIVHNLGYAPAFMVFYFDPIGNQYNPLPILTTTSAGAPGPSLPFSTRIYAYSDLADLNIVWEGNAQTTNQSFYYFIFNNPVTTS